MFNPFGPRATLIDAGPNPQLSAFWRRRMTMLVPTSQTSPLLSRRSLLWLAFLGVLVFGLPTFRQGAGPILAAEEPGAVATKPAQAGAIAEIEKLGGKVVLDEKSPGKPVVSVDFFRTQVTDADLKHLKGLSQLKYLNLYQANVTDAGLDHLQGLSQLEGLMLTGTRVTDSGLEHLKGLTQLQTLHLGGPKITDAGLEHLTGLGKLKMLSLSDTRVSQQGVKRLQEALPNCKIATEPQAAPKPIAQDKKIGEWQRSTWQLGLSLDLPSLVPPAVQYAILDNDPVPGFTARVKKMQTYYRQDLERADEAEKEMKRSIHMSVSWDLGFQEVTGDKLYLLTSVGLHSLSSNASDGKKWIVTKTVRVKGKPVCWCLPVEVKKGERIEVKLAEGNAFDLGAAFTKAMQESNETK